MPLLPSQCQSTGNSQMPVSVSSNGSMPLLPQHDATTCQRCMDVSVSSNGSMPLLLVHSAWSADYACATFQYPQTDRCLCYIDSAVSCRLVTVIGFSILKRIDASATARVKNLLAMPRDLFARRGPFSGLSACRFLRCFPLLVYTKRVCFANRFLRKIKADFREEKEKYTGSNEENGQRFGKHGSFCRQARAIFETTPEIGGKAIVGKGRYSRFPNGDNLPSYRQRHEFGGMTVNKLSP